MTKDIYITDLAKPVLNAEQQTMLEYCNTLEFNFDCRRLLDEASEAAGLDDFGPEDFLTRLNLLLDEWGGDPGLTGLGRLTARNKLLQFARSRLLIQDLLNRRPEIHREVIEAPIIVAGLPRSGTTHLLNLLAADLRLRPLPLWESYEPVPMPGEPATADSSDPRYQRSAKSWAAMQKTSPFVAAMHPMDPDHIHEELELMGPDFASYNFEWLGYLPRWRDHYYATDQTPHYEYMKTVLKILQWQDRQRAGPDYRPKRWVLKCPQHLEQLPVLKAVFPDAVAPITFRDPVSVIQSTLYITAYGQRISRQSVLMDELAVYWTDRIEHLLHGCARDRHIWGPEQSIDVPFHQFMADDFAMAERIYQVADLPMTNTARQQIQGYIASHPRGKGGRVIYDLKGAFGLDPESLRERFQFYFDNFPVKAESSG